MGIILGGGGGGGGTPILQPEPLFYNLQAFRERPNCNQVHKPLDKPIDLERKNLNPPTTSLRATMQI